MRSKPAIRKPTHRLMHDGQCYALVRCGHGSPAVTLISTGETVRSASFMLDCDLLMGRWQAGLHYLFGADCDHVPPGATLEPTTNKGTST